MTGYAVEEILGRNCRFLQGPDTDPTAVRALADLVRSEATGAVTLLNYRKDGRPWWNEVTLSPMRDAAGVVTHMIGVQQDVTARVRAEAEVARLGSTDPLTGLPNRCTGLRGIERLIDGGRSVALVFCDLDGFKQVNDRHGHVVGDRLLHAVGRGLSECLTDGESVFRFGGDEFVVVVEGVDEDPVRLADLVGRLEVAVAGVGGGYGVGVSTGVAVHDGETPSPTALIEAADQAMYRNKRIRQVLAACGVQ
jgi:diguanylate cyclase (GGDEF)-like protein/PAS domain S-box-containing protein